MKLDLSGKEVINTSPERLWEALNSPDVLTRCIPGCKSMTETAPDHYDVLMELKVAAVGGTFEGKVALTEKQPPSTCNITVSGEGSLGNGTGKASFTITPEPDGASLLTYEGEGEIGGLVAGVGQRILKSVSKHLTGQFFKALRKECEASEAERKAG
ncbi:carbon monoxide dehydrogenase [Arsenicitalea aurantiaca]|uniref:Carbon monoxide dehydrogenase n=1 Tax=Arsenicitalea aurantiaca TaxID=1783274 RepID=A0A433XKR7_9HYPH|nr:carbon monoxide dehydrogenase subunit G [Arsenicitalea aurantiaca]RUT34675.1 carbon monoxide dehydrogenase [Arsenicitalea aurantiaca]